MKFLTHLGIGSMAVGLLLAGGGAAVSAQAKGAGLVITPVSNAALTAPIRSTSGTVKSIVGREITLDVGGRHLSFIVDDRTEVLASGAGRGPRHSVGSLPITLFVRSGDVARVAYRELDGARRVAEIHKGRQ
jgi:hypothetical protein